MVAATPTLTKSSASSIAVCSKLPFDFAAEHAGKTVIFKGGKHIDPVTAEAYLTGAYGITRDVDAAWFKAWSESVGDFKALQTGAIFGTDSKDPEGEAREISSEVATGLEQKTEAQLGVQVSTNEK